MKNACCRLLFGASFLVLATGASSGSDAKNRKFIGPMPDPATNPAKSSISDVSNMEPEANPTDPLLQAIPMNHPTTLTLQQSIDAALAQATLILKSRNDQALSGEQLLQSYAQFLPNLDVAGNYNYQGGKAYLTTATPTLVNTRATGLSFQVTSTLNLFAGFGDYSSWRSANLKRSASDDSLARARQQIILDVTQSYLQVVLDQDVVKISEKNLTLSQQRQVLLQEQTRLGVKNMADLFRQQAETSANESLLINSRVKERNDKLLLISKLRMDEKADYLIERPPGTAQVYNKAYEDEAKLVQLGLDKRLDLKASDEIAKGADWDTAQARSGFYPRLDLGATYIASARNLDQQDISGFGITPFSAVPPNQAGLFNQLGNQGGYVVGLTLSWGIFDRLTTRLSMERAKTVADNLTIDADDRRLQVISDVRQAFGDYRASFAQLESSRKGLEAAQKAYEVVEGRYDVGSANFIDLIAAQDALVSAESARAQAVVNYELQNNQLEFALGTL